ncbi:MAG: hypothetical protein WC415_05855 [Patescibacteria group bacterium]|jgi:hypothetical protein
MICLSCKKQIPDKADVCPFCDTPVSHKEQVVKEISIRRWQRWFFYGVLIIVFSGMVGVVVKVYSINSKILAEMATAQRTITEKETAAVKAQKDLQIVQAEAAKAKADIDNVQSELSGKDEALATKVAELETTINEKIKITANYELLSTALKNISVAAVGISNEDLNKIPVADVWPTGLDTDGDGLPDDVEQALGTSATSTDTDGDSFSDKMEISGGFDPLGAGRISIDKDFADKQRGKVFKQSWAGGYLWYVGTDGLRYFLGKTE